MLGNIDNPHHSFSLGSCTGPCEALKEWLKEAWLYGNSNVHLRQIATFVSILGHDADHSSSNSSSFSGIDYSKRSSEFHVIGSVTADSGVLVLDANNPTAFDPANEFQTLTNTDKEKLFSPFLQYDQNRSSNLVPSITSYPELNIAHIVCPIVTYNAQIHGFLVLEFESSPLSPTVSVKLVPNKTSMMMLSLIIGDLKHTINSAKTAKTIEELASFKTDYETILDMFNGLIAYSDVEGNLFFMNDFGLDYFGTSMANIKENRWVELVEGGRQEKALEEWASVVQERNTKPVTMETRLRCHNGEYHWFSHTVAFRNGKFCTISMDVEDLVSARYKAMENEALIRILVDNIPGVVWTTDKYAQVDYISPNFTKITGLPGKNWFDAVHPEDKPHTDKALEALRTIDYTPPMQPIHATNKLRYVQKDGSYKQYQASYTTMLDNKGRFLKWVGISFDIDEVENAKNHAVAFTRMISHELRTPFAGVLGNLELLEDTNLTVEQKDLLFTSKKSTERLLDIINDILNFSKLEAGRMRIESIVFSLSDLVDDLIELLSPLIVGKGLELFGWVESEVDQYLVGDPTRIRQVILNLLGNAIKFSESGHVRLTCSLKERLLPSEMFPNGRIRIECIVEDTGIGLTEEEQKMLFKPFVQTDSSTTRMYGGTGLGLSISAELAKLMNGTISCESVKGKGSTFKFECIVETAPPPSPPSMTETRLPLSIESNPVAYLVSSSEYLRQQITSSLTDIGNFHELKPTDGEELGQELVAKLHLTNPPRCTLLFDIQTESDVVQLSKCLQSVRMSSSSSSDEIQMRIVVLVGSAFYHDEILNTVIGQFGGHFKSVSASSSASSASSTKTSPSTQQPAPPATRIKWDILKVRKPLCKRKVLGIFATRTAKEANASGLLSPPGPTPIAPVSSPEPAQSFSPPPAVPPTPSPSSLTTTPSEFTNRKALIAEDNPISQRLLVKQLKKAGFKTVVAANNGEEAVQHYKRYGPGYFDIGIFDHHMPLKDGAEAAKEIREMEEADGAAGQSLPIMCLTADVGQDAHQQTMALGINRVLTKPLSQKDLVKVLEEVL